MKNIFLGIDYSLKSPAICIINNDTYKWISHPAPLPKKPDFERQKNVTKLDDVKLIFKEEREVSEEYSKNEFSKINHYRQSALAIIDLILDELSADDVENSMVHIGFEGFSFGSASNNLIDTIGATTCLKVLLIEKQVFKNYSLNIYSPKQIKKLAGYGSYDKMDLFDVFIGNYDYIKVKYAENIKKDKKGNFKLDYNDEHLSGDFVEYCQNLPIKRTVKKPKVPKPIDDLIDSYFVACCVRSKVLVNPV